MIDNIFTKLFQFFIFWYICGFILVGFDILPSWLEWSNSVFIITSGLLAVLYFMKMYDPLVGIVLSAGIFVTTFIVEYFGSSTSFLFGDYYYTDQFAPNVMNVPIAIGFAWVMVIATGLALIRLLAITNAIVRALLGGLAALAMDLVLDPVAYLVKGYWIWEEAGLYYDIPWTNFFGWFIIAFCIHFLLSFVRQQQRFSSFDQKMLVIYIGIIVMFAWIALLATLWLATIIGLLSAAFVFVLMYLKRGANA